MNQLVTAHEIESILDFKITDYMKNILEETPIYYEDLSEKEHFETLLECIKNLMTDIPKVGSHRFNVWDNGWKENYDNYKATGNYSDLIPKYFEKYSSLNSISRWNKKFVKSKTYNFNCLVNCVLIDAILQNFVSSECENLYEFGCGTAFNLLRFFHYNSSINLYGLDWTNSSQMIIEEIKKNNPTIKLEGHNFNYFDVNHNFKLKENSVIFTSNSLEQIGDSFKNVVDYWIAQKPQLCINLEPDSEIMDKHSLFDQLSNLYAEKRNYLDGFFNYLKELESKNVIEIIYMKRTYAGSKYHEAFPVVVWKVL